MLERFKLYRRAVSFLLLVAVYFLAGKLGLRLAMVNPSASAVWPPTGIALAVLLVWGYRVWPAIFLGAFLVNLTTAGTVTSSFFIAIGNTLEGVVGAALVNRYAHGRHVFDSSYDFFKFVAFAVLGSTVVSATIGTLTLVFAKLASFSHFGSIWQTWWQGDAMGCLLVAPFLIMWSANPRLEWTRRQRFEAPLLLAVICLSALAGFCAWFPFPMLTNFLRVSCIPLVIWASFRFGPREAATTSLLLSAIAVWGTLHGWGPFAAENSPNNALLRLQMFMGMVTMVGISIGIEVMERKQAVRALIQNNEHLELRVQERTVSLAQTINDLKIEAAQRREISHSLKENEERQQLFIAAVKDYAIYMLDPQGHVVSWNAGAERIKGYTAQEVLGRHISLFYTNADIQAGKPERDLRVAVSEGQVKEVDRRVRKDGSMFWADNVLNALFDKAGQLRGFVKVTRDITESKENEKKIQIYRDVVKNMQIGVVVLHLENPDDAKTLRLISTNPGATQTTGFDMETVVGKRISAVFPKLYETPVPEKFAEVARSGQAQDLGEIRYGDDRVKEGIFFVRAFPLPDQCVGIAFENITERRKTEEALNDSEERFHRLLGSNIIGFMMVDMEGKVLDANDAFLNALGYTREELDAGIVGGPEMTPPEYSSMDEWVRTRLNDVGYCPPFEKQYIRKDGSRWPVLVGEVRMDAPEPYCVCFVIDVTERRRAQQALQEAYDDMERRVMARTQELVHANTELQKEITRRKEAEEQLRNLSLSDPLTGLYNRRGFMALADQHLLLAIRDKNPFLVFFIDVDGLKQINDTLGHARGDQALIKAADVLRETFRKSDILARVGGDEFAVVVTQAGPDQRSAYMNRLRTHLRHLNEDNQFPFLLSLSVGVSTFNLKKMSSLEELMTQADQDLYHRKRLRHQQGINVIRAA